ncbi:SURF1 family cytochrome oxidase biogenesis protein [Leucobacter sp. NPDC077196]|uniref:SURF1 family cytochrome oxidase biogenesis protein n=1 Tax=Leucobacter sp. NPDC077196 TaxID=3154959 RepID=UPI003427425C
MASRKLEYLGEPTLAQVMRRPSWILALLLALGIAVAFAALAQWQAGIAVQSQQQEQVDTESERPLASVTSFDRGVTDAGAGVVVRLGGAFVAEDFDVVSPRDNGGTSGAWVVGHLITDGPDAEPGAHLAVAVGWAPSVAEAERSADALAAASAASGERELTGRYMPPEGPQVPDADEDPLTMRAMVPAALANLWSTVDGPVYSGYLVLHDDSGSADALGAASLDPIDSVAPLAADAVNWLNVFYALEWLVFGGFAIFFWYRLARDAWEKEHELLLLEAETTP